MGSDPEKVKNIQVIEGGVRRLISEEFGVEVQSVSAETDIVEELGADQFDMDSMKIAAEQKFLIKISDENWRKMKTVRDIVNLVDVHLEIKQIEM